nr:DUF58 domain-containing protein [Anaerolineae bacterium]
MFDQETGGDVWLVLDLDRDVQVGRGERSAEEMGVIVPVSVAALLLDAGRAVGLIAYGPQRRMSGWHVRRGRNCVGRCAGSGGWGGCSDRA